MCSTDFTLKVSHSNVLGNTIKNKKILDVRFLNFRMAGMLLQDQNYLRKVTPYLSISLGKTL
jgi:hypothetical protein